MTMKKSIYILFALLLSVGAVLAQGEGFNIKGKIFDSKEGSVILLRRNPETWKADTVAWSPVVDGKFELAGKMDQPTVCFLRFVVKVYYNDTTGVQKSVFIATTDVLVVENTDIIYESYVRGTGLASHIIVGSDYNDKTYQMDRAYPELHKLKQKYIAINDYALLQKQEGLPQDEVNVLAITGRAAYGAFVNERQNYVIDELNNGDDLMLKALMLNAFGIPNNFTSEETKKLQQEIAGKYGADNYHARYISALLERRKINTQISVGNQYKDVASKNMNNEMVKLSSAVGSDKYVLLEFWASWCGPCRKEIPNMKRDYAEFHEKGFEIYSISIDKSESAWRKASDAENFPWQNSIKLNDPTQDAQKTYNVSAIPANFLIGPDGKIVGRNLRGDMLTKKLEDLLN